MASLLKLDDVLDTSDVELGVFGVEFGPVRYINPKQAYAPVSFLTHNNIDNNDEAGNGTSHTFIRTPVLLCHSSDDSPLTSDPGRLYYIAPPRTLVDHVRNASAINPENIGAEDYLVQAYLTPSPNWVSMYVGHQKWKYHDTQGQPALKFLNPAADGGSQEMDTQSFLEANPLRAAGNKHYLCDAVISLTVAVAKYSGDRQPGASVFDNPQCKWNLAMNLHECTVLGLAPCTAFTVGPRRSV